LVTGDAYVDHPGFGAALIGRYLVLQGYRVGIVAQPDWKTPESVMLMGHPRLFAGITAGAMDSMISNYTANKKLRRDDAYAPGGHYGLRPNRATLVYSNLIKQAFPGLPEADILVYGMGEKPVEMIARRLANREDLAGIPGTAVVRTHLPADKPVCLLPGYEEILADKTLLARAALKAEPEQLPQGRILAQACQKRYVLVYPPAAPLSTQEMDAIYALPFTREAHPAYAEKIPALEPVRFSVTTHRGCFGGCTFCVLGAHQGKIIQSRSAQSILTEIRALAKRPDFRGTITDLGGPSANMYQLACRRPQGACSRPSCLFPTRCSHLATSHGPQLALLQAAARIPGVKHVFVASGIRFDLAMADPKYLDGLIAGQHVSGVLKIAPEHLDPEVLRLMRKPPPERLIDFLRTFRAAARRLHQPAHITAYFIASFPGSTPKAMRTAQQFSQAQDLRVEQMQDFIPLPMTLAGIMYYTERDPWTGKPLAVAKTFQERSQQRWMLLGRTPGAPRKKRRLVSPLEKGGF
jgi:uncharacterized radical SAM protein YgiQ